MAKIKYNIKLWADKAANLGTDTSVYKENDFIFATDSGVLKKGDGVKTYAELGSIGTVAAWKDIADKPATFEPSEHDHAVADISDWPESFPPAEHDHAVADISDWPESFPPAEHDHAVADISDWPESFPPAEHDHAVVEDEESGLEAAETLQGLAEALSARIADLDDRVALIEEEPVE